MICLCLKTLYAFSARDSVNSSKEKNIQLPYDPTIPFHIFKRIERCYQIFVIVFRAVIFDEYPAE